jgi:hypothetical protein
LRQPVGSLYQVIVHCSSVLSHLIVYSIVEGSSEGYLSSETVVVGYGLGQLSAAALSCSHNAHELVNISTEIVRLAFRIGAYIRKSTIGSQISDVTELPWAVNVEGTLDEVVEKLETLQNELVRVRLCWQRQVANGHRTFPQQHDRIPHSLLPQVAE